MHIFAPIARAHPSIAGEVKGAGFEWKKVSVTISGALGKNNDAEALLADLKK